MTNKTKTIISASLVFLLSACNGVFINENHNELSVRTEPAGASVYVMGEQQGVTPMTLNITKLYPVAYSKENDQDYGRITFKREGCTDRTVKVTNQMSGKVINEKLSCADDEQAVVNDAVTQGVVVNKVSATKQLLSDKSVRQRLQELQMLKDDGLIDDEEYQQVRQRILQSL